MSSENQSPVESEQRLGLVIGVNEAPHSRLTPLNYAINDAEAMAETLQNHCGFTLPTPPLIGADATSANVKKAILALARRRTDNDFLLLYFSGHGQPMTVGGDQSDIYLVTSDFSETDTKEDDTLHCSMRWLQDKLYIPTAAGKVLLILDCCYAGNMGRTAPDPYLEDLKMRINQYFGAPGAASGARSGGLRLALTATGHDRLAREKEGHGIMTGRLLECLQGTIDEVIDLDDCGNVSLQRLHDYLLRVMPASQHPSVSGDYAGRKCILAQYEQRAAELRQRKYVLVNETPHTHIPLARSSSFQRRPGEFDNVARLLFTEETGKASTPPRVVGLIGMGGIGKTQLAVEIAYEYKERFAAGIFWTTATGTSLPGWQRQFAELAANAAYLPAGDDVSHPENEVRRARHIARYLAHHPDALLLLDNVEHIEQLLDALTTFASEEVHCTILYTSRTDVAPTYVKQHRVSKLPDEEALRLLLERRPDLLERILPGAYDQEIKAAHDICQYIECLPLALTLLRDLLQDTHLTLMYLNQQLRGRGVLDITREQDMKDARLFQTFLLSWQKVHNTNSQRLFKLASFFPEAAPVPLWLLALAANLEGNTSLEPLGRARMVLSRWSLIEELPGDAIRLHPIIREFARHLVSQDSGDNALLAAAREQLTNAFMDVNKLEQRVLDEGYWKCLERVQEVVNYAQQLGIEQTLERVGYWLARDSSLLGIGVLWPEVLPGLFYQQLHNRAIEEGYQLPGIQPSARWIRQQIPVGAEDQSLLREFRHPDGVTSVAFSPDSRLVVTGCEDFGVRLWDASSGQMLQVLQGHNSPITGVAISPDGSKAVTCSYDDDALLWDVLNGQLIWTLHGHRGVLRSVAFSPDGRQIATRSDDRTVRVWDVATGEMVAVLIRGTGWVEGFAFSPDGKQIAISSPLNVEIWDIEHEQLVVTLTAGGKLLAWVSDKAEHLSTVFSPDGKYVLCGSLNGVYIWDMGKQKGSQDLLFEDYLLYTTMSYRVSDTTLSTDCKHIALISANKVEVFQIHDMRMVLSCAHNTAVTSVAFSSDGTNVVTGSSDGTTRIWKISSASQIKWAILPYTEAIESMVFSSTGTQLVTFINKGAVWVWNVVDGEMIRTLQVEDDRQIDCASLSFDGKKVVIGTNGRIQITDIERDQYLNYSIPLELLLLNPLISCIASSHNGMNVAIATNQEEVQVWSLEPWKRIGVLRGHEGDIKQMAFSPDGSKLVTGATDGTARIWEIANGTQLAVLKEYAGRSIGISSDGRLVATGLFSNAICVSFMENGNRLMLLEGHTQPVTMLSFSPTGRFLLSADQAGQVLFWRVDVHGEATNTLLGMYIAANEIGAVYWQDEQHVILADLGGMHNHPHFYHLALEGTW